MNQRTRRLVKDLESQGFTVKPVARGRRLMVRGRRGSTVIAIAPSEANRGAANTLAALRRLGFRPGN